MSNTETGHAKNAANFEHLVSFTESLGTFYNPSTKSLYLSALQTQLASAKKALSGLNAAKAQYSKAIAEREKVFKPLKKHLTRVGKAIKVSETSDEIKDDAKSILRKLQGRRATPKLTKEEIKELAANGINRKQISTSQQGFDNRIENFDKLIMLLESQPSYAPNENNLKTTSLRALHSELKAKNTAAINANNPLINARSERNSILYTHKTGVVHTASDVKEYIHSIEEITKEQLKTISKLQFVQHNELV